MGPGEKAKLLTVTDNLMADKIRPTHSIEVNFGRGPRTGYLVAAIVVFKKNTEDFNHDIPPEKVTPELFAEMQKQIQEETQVLARDVEMRKDRDPVKLLQWTVQKMYELFDRYNSDATFGIYCSALKVRERISKRRIMKERADPKKTFDRAGRILTLLSKGYEYDDWNKVIRRGRINAEMAKR